MGAEQHIQWQDAAASALEWWADAGVDTLVEDELRDWFATPAPPARPLAVTSAPAADLPPDTLDAFMAWRMGDAVPEASWNAQPVPVQAQKNPSLMILTDLPEPDDSDEAGWMTGPVGVLLDRMLAAIGEVREQVVIAGIAHARPLTGRMPADAQGTLEELARRLVTLVAPQRLLLFGAEPCRALLGPDGQRGGLRTLNHDGLACPTIATFHPRFLLERPLAKAETWRHLQLLIREPTA
ncbi:uracil-DNA glycosylase family protein [uncultured Sphingomonas sp.]|uniref:uracil-DNA glycosylase family protein n=1 Tax=uncultured Sphingomonas sp. TaxID=158754 RepID=UPI0025F0D8A3|nr:uracil-DNA glycosylase family protein [uncultured Sphingomonas sp.]